MPELPDLQAFSYNLSKILTGKKVENLHAIRTKKLNTTEQGLNRALKGSTVKAVYRDGKELHVAFDNGRVLALHLMLKGQLQIFSGDNDRRGAVLELVFSDGTGLVLKDYQGQATPTLDPPAKSAPDALSPDAGYAFLREKFRASRLQVKKLLTDQRIIRGIGNAYADEILWHARLSPFSVCNKVPDAAIKKLAGSIRTVLTRAERMVLKAQPDIISGEVREFLAIHNPEKTLSPTGAKILVDTSGSRKTYYTEEQVCYE